MIDSNEYKDQENKESDTALVPSELHILVTDADTNGYEISKMSDFMGLYAQQLTRSLADSPFVEVVSNIPVADLGIINDVVQHAAVVARGNITLVQPASRDKRKAQTGSILYRRLKTSGW